MKRHEAQALIDVIQRFTSDDEPKDRAAAAGKGPAKVSAVAGRQQPAEVTRGAADVAERFTSTAVDEEALYQRFKERFIEEARIDPVLLHLIATRPEIVVEVEPRVVKVDGSSAKGRVARLMAQGWFTEPRAVAAVRAELKRTGSDPGGGGTLYDVLGAFKRDGFLVDEAQGYKIAPGVKVTEHELSVR